MASLLETLLTLVGVILILALASQALQELVKVFFPIRSHTRQQALSGLLQEASVATDLNRVDGQKIFDAVMERLRGLGQSGVRPSAVRLDSLTAEDLKGLVEKIDYRSVPSLAALDDGQSQLEAVAERTREWFALAMAGPVDARNGRRNRAVAVITAAVVVLGLNVDAVTVLERARADPAFRASVIESAQRLDSLNQELQAAQDAESANHDDVETARAALDDALATVLSGDDAVLANIGGDRKWNDVEWWAGILIMTLLISLGASFWHDTLGALFGVKKRIYAQATAAAGRSEPDNPNE